MSEDICNTCMYSTHLESNWIWGKPKVVCTKTGKDMRKSLTEGKVECYMCKPRKGCMACTYHDGEPVVMADGRTYIGCRATTLLETRLRPLDTDLVCDQYIPIRKPIMAKEAKE